MATKGFIKDWKGNQILPITRAELVLDKNGNIALTSPLFEAGYKREDGTVNEYGLISAVERAMISGGTNGQGIGDLYKKLGYINTGLLINGNSVNFYDDNGEQSVINLKSTTDSSKILINKDGNDICFNLATITTSDTKIENSILKNITVDQYGRVTQISGSKLTNADIPNLDSKEITNSSLTSCSLTTCTTSVEDIAQDPKAIVNRSYVDKAIQRITGLATGALKFGGSIKTAEEASNRLSDSNYLNYYFKATETFTLSANQLYSETESTSNQLVKPGDTLIIHTKDGIQKYVYVPSGDDITTITVSKQGEDSIIDQQVGNIGFQFSSVFQISNIGENHASITLPKADSSNSGYLSSEDYIKFSSYAEDLSVEYTQLLSSDSAGKYEIGKIKIGSNETTLYGKNSVSNLTLDNGATNAFDPILKFEETGTKAKNFTFKGGSGIKIRKVENQDVIEYISDVKISQNSTTYLSSDGYQIGAKIGSITTEENTQTINDGLTDYREFSEFRNNTLTVLNSTLIFQSITDSLNDTTKDLHYGSNDLVNAIKIVI